MLKIYLETSIPSYLTAKSNRDLVRTARQQITSDWWESRRKDFELHVSTVVIEEASEGDVEAAQRRLDILKGIPVLDVTKQARTFAKRLIKRVPLPAKAAVDALHIAVAVAAGMDYLLTWNCVHIANASLRGQIERVCRGKGYSPPIICTPDELMED